MNAGQSAGRGHGWALVTGGTRGIGRGLVAAFAEAGYSAVFTFQHSIELARALEEQLAETGGGAHGFQCDCSDDTAVGELAVQLLQARGAPQVIVNNVGITRDVPMLRMNAGQWNEVMAANLDSAFFVTRHFIGPMMERGGGVVLQMSSVSGIKGNVGQSNYGASKAAMIGMTRSLALEVSRFNIRVNAVVPGFIATEMAGQIPEAQQATLKRTIPLRRFGTVQEVASLCLYLASDAAGYITGQSFVIDGGLSA